MKWNIYILGGSIIFEGILYWFYEYRKNLPLIKNRLFAKMLIWVLVSGILNFNLTLLDINFNFTMEEKWLLYFLHVVYFIQYEVIFVLIFMYGINYIGKWKDFKKKQVLYLLPLIICSILIITSPWTHWIYQISNTYPDIGFVRGKYFEIIPLTPFSYVCIYFIIKYKDKKGIRKKLEMRKANRKLDKVTSISVKIAFIGIVVNYYFKSVLLIEFFLSISLMIMYIAMENPEFYHWESSNIYNLKGFLSLVSEYILEKRKFYCCGIDIVNFNSLKTYHGLSNVYDAMIELGDWINENLIDCYVFYTNNQYFVIVSENELDVEAILEVTKERFSKPFKTKDSEILFEGKMFSVDDPYMFNNEQSLLSGMNAALNEIDKNTEEIFYIDIDIYQKVMRKDEITKIIHNKIIEKDVQIYLQPIYNCVTKKISGAEALARIFEDKLGMISPGEFIPITESNGEILQLGLVIFEKTCEYICNNNLDKMGIEFINVNLSPVQLLDPYLVSDLKRIVDKYEVDISKIHFEITETNIEETSIVEHQIKKLNEIGADIVLDDFGKGNSNLERLSKYPFKVGKIDALLVWNYFGGKDKFIEYVISLFKDNRLIIVAEGIEEEYMVDTLCLLGCKYLQGYYFSKPLPQEEFSQFVEIFNKNKQRCV